MAKMILETLAEKLLSRVDPEILEKVDAIPRHNINQFGTDPFGFDPNIIKFIAPIAMWFYKHYFRCLTRGMENIPDGRFMLIGNHSGQLPFDAMMLGTAVLVDSPKPRMVRGMVERWSAELPFISTLFNRSGQIVGDPAVARKLLEQDEGLMVFPEGVRGISKLFKDRYKLKSFGHGFMRLALEAKTPIVPAAIIGPEEQAPAVANFDQVAKVFGLPALPLILPQVLPLPLPVKYHIWIGEPLTFSGAADEDDDVVASYVHEVEDTIQRMIDEGLKQREHIF
jgi:1-acyl-sn-glycerol-3-phosphate acyltransferase